MLYQLSYAPIFWQKCTALIATAGLEDFGGDEGTRTPNPRVANAMLYQLSYIPTSRPWSRPPRFHSPRRAPPLAASLCARDDDGHGSFVMTRWLLQGTIAAVLALASPAAARSDDDACWQLLYGAIERNAAAQHAEYISYSELVNIQSDGHRFEFANASITYRDDGMASVDDDRWDQPFISDQLEPGPPVLGPYGVRREEWLAAQTQGSEIPTIADLHNAPKSACVDRGDQNTDGTKAAHVVLPAAPRDRPALKEIWIDRQSLAIVRVVVSEYLTFYLPSTKLERELTDYTLDVENIDGYVVLRRVTWSYSVPYYDQRSSLVAEYDFGNYQFGTTPPPESLFAKRN